LKFQLKNVIITRVSWHLGKRKKENKCEIHNWPIGCTGSFQHIFVSLFYLCAVLSPSTDSVKGASFNTQYAMSIYEQIFPAHDVTELMHIITHYN